MSNPMITQGLTDAIKAEVEGYHFYMMAAKTTSDGQGKQVFEKLAKEEMEHIHFLRAHYQSFLNLDHADPNVKLTKPQFSITSPIFSESLRTRIHDAHYEMTALSVGIQLELSAIKFYQEQANKINDPSVKQFYLALADWESNHYNFLLHQQEALKQDYWAASDFAPF